MGIRRHSEHLEYLLVAALLCGSVHGAEVEAKKKAKKTSKSSKSKEDEAPAAAASPGAGPTSSPAAQAAPTSAPTPAAAPTVASPAPLAGGATAGGTASAPVTTPSPAVTPPSPAVNPSAPGNPAPAAPAPAPAALTGSAPVGSPAAVPMPTARTMFPQGMAPISVAPPAPASTSPLCVEPRKVLAFTDEALIVPRPVMKRWSAGRGLYAAGTTLSMTAMSVGAISGVVLLAGGSTASLSDPGPALALAGTVGNITGTTFLFGGLALQHSALGMIGKDSGRGRFIAGVIFGLLGLAAVGAGYVVSGFDIPNKDIVNYSLAYGGSTLLTTSSSILISDARNLAEIWERLGLRPPAPPALLLPNSPPMNPPPQPAPEQ